MTYPNPPPPAKLQCALQLRGQSQAPSLPFSVLLLSGARLDRFPGCCYSSMYPCSNLSTQFSNIQHVSFPTTTNQSLPPADENFSHVQLRLSQLHKDIRHNRAKYVYCVYKAMYNCTYNSNNLEQTEATSSLPYTHVLFLSMKEIAEKEKNVEVVITHLQMKQSPYL